MVRSVGHPVEQVWPWLTDAGITQRLLIGERDGQRRSVGADRPRTLGRLDRYLRAHETGLLTPVFDCPAVVVRLAVQLAATGHTEITALGCSRCGQQVELTQRPGERICASCVLQDQAVTCARCGAITNRVARRLPEGAICCSCYAKDPLARRRCSNCGRMRRPTRRLADGGVLCQGCAPRPEHTCSRCGRTRPAQCITDDGPICNRCYVRTKLSRVCGLVVTKTSHHAIAEVRLLPRRRRDYSGP